MKFSTEQIVAAAEQLQRDLDQDSPGAGSRRYLIDDVTHDLVNILKAQAAPALHVTMCMKKRLWSDDDDFHPEITIHGSLFTTVIFFANGGDQTALVERNGVGGGIRASFWKDVDQLGGLHVH